MEKVTSLSQNNTNLENKENIIDYNGKKYRIKFFKDEAFFPINDKEKFEKIANIFLEFQKSNNLLPQKPGQITKINFFEGKIYQKIGNSEFKERKNVSLENFKKMQEIFRDVLNINISINPFKKSQKTQKTKEIKESKAAKEKAYLYTSTKAKQNPNACCCCALSLVAKLILLQKKDLEKKDLEDAIKKGNTGDAKAREPSSKNEKNAKAKKPYDGFLGLDDQIFSISEEDKKKFDNKNTQDIKKLYDHYFEENKGNTIQKNKTLKDFIIQNVIPKIPEIPENSCKIGLLNKGKINEKGHEEGVFFFALKVEKNNGNITIGFGDSHGYQKNGEAFYIEFKGKDNEPVDNLINFLNTNTSIDPNKSPYVFYEIEEKFPKENKEKKE